LKKCHPYVEPSDRAPYGKKSELNFFTSYFFSTFRGTKWWACSFCDSLGWPRCERLVEHTRHAMAANARATASVQHPTFLRLGCVHSLRVFARILAPFLLQQMKKRKSRKNTKRASNNEFFLRGVGLLRALARTQATFATAGPGQKRASSHSEQQPALLASGFCALAAWLRTHYRIILGAASVEKK
jgi:hypothetical protein